MRMLCIKQFPFIKRLIISMPIKRKINIIFSLLYDVCGASKKTLWSTFYALTSFGFTCSIIWSNYLLMAPWLLTFWGGENWMVPCNLPSSYLSGDFSFGDWSPVVSLVDGQTASAIWYKVNKSEHLSHNKYNAGCFKFPTLILLFGILWPQHPLCTQLPHPWPPRPPRPPPWPLRLSDPLVLDLTILLHLTPPVSITQLPSTNPPSPLLTPLIPTSTIPPSTFSWGNAFLNTHPKYLVNFPMVGWNFCRV